MSLVREALAKAEREAAARAARETGLPAELSAIPQPYRARRRARWAWSVGLAAAALAGATAALLLLPAGEKSVSGSQVPTGAAGAAAALGSKSKEAPLKGEERPADTPESAGVAATPAETLDEATVPSTSSLATASATDLPASAIEEPATATKSSRESAAVGSAASALERTTDARTELSIPSASAGARAGAPPGGSHVLEVALGGGRAIRLGGIAWSEAAPLAYLNGRLVGVGEYVEGYRVAAIERDRVRFDGGDEAVGVRFEVRLR